MIKVYVLQFRFESAEYVFIDAKVGRDQFTGKARHQRGAVLHEPFNPFKRGE